MNQLGARARRRPGAHGPRAAGPPPERGAWPRCCRSCVGLELEDAPVRGRARRSSTRSSARRARARIDAAWRGPEFLPTLDELSRPDRLARPGRRRGVSPATASAGSTDARAVRAPFAAGLAASIAPVVVALLGRRRLAGAARARAPTPALDPIAVHVDHGLRPGERRRGRRRRPTLARGSARGSVRAGRRSTAGPATSRRGRRDARYAALERRRVGARRDGGAGRPHRRRPGRDRAAQRAARRRRRRARGRWRPRRGHDRAPAARRAGAPRPTRCAPRSG